jgi:hypothetical protein
VDLVGLARALRQRGPPFLFRLFNGKSPIAGDITWPDFRKATPAVLETHLSAFELVGQEERVEALETQVRQLKAQL